MPNPVERVLFVCVCAMKSQNISIFAHVFYITLQVVGIGTGKRGY